MNVNEINREKDMYMANELYFPMAGILIVIS